MSEVFYAQIGEALAGLSRRVAEIEAKSAIPPPEPLPVKALEDLADQVSSASEQASLDGHDTRQAIMGAAKMIADALDRNTKALEGKRDGEKEPTA